MQLECNGIADSTPFYMRLYNHTIHLIWADNRPHNIRPVHPGEDPQEVMNNWKEELFC